MLDKVFAFALNRTFSRDEAEELSQEIIYQALKNLHTIKDETRFEPWFWQVAHNTLKVFKRDKGKERNCYSFDSVAPIPIEDEYAFEELEIAENLRRQIASLSACYRDIIVMYYYDDMTCKQIAEKLRIPEGTVTYRLSLARSKLKKECSNMNETVLKPVKLSLSISGEGNYNGKDRPFPWTFINDALSQNILWYAYRQPKTMEELSKLTGVLAFYIEESIKNLIAREAMIHPTKNTVQTDFMIFDDLIAQYSINNASELAEALEEPFWKAASLLTEKTIKLGVSIADKTFDELICLFSLLALDKLISEYPPSEYKKPPIRYDGNMWQYHANVIGVSYDDGVLAMNKNLNSSNHPGYEHHCYQFTPFVLNKMMFDHELDICRVIHDNATPIEKQKETIADMLAHGYLRKKNGEIMVSMPVFSAEQYSHFTLLATEIFSTVMLQYSQKLRCYINGYIKLFPPHLRDAANRNGFYLFVAMFSKIASKWISQGKLHIPDGATCDVLIEHE